MDHKSSGHSSKNRSNSRNKGGGGRDQKSDGGKRFLGKPEPEQARTLAQKFLRFFGFGKPAEPTKEKPSKERKRDDHQHPVSNERLFVGNLSYTVGEEDLTEFFGKAGKVVKAEVVTNRQTNRSKGFGFVTMGSVNDAERAVDQLNGASFQGREITVSGAKSDGQKEDSSPRERERRPRRSKDESERRDSRPRPDRSESRDRSENRRDRGRDGDRKREGGGRGRGQKSSAGPTVVPMAVEQVSAPFLSMLNLSDDFGQTELEHLFAGVAKVASSTISDGKADIEMASVEDAQTAIRLLHGKDFMGKTLSLSSRASS